MKTPTVDDTVDELRKVLTPTSMADILLSYLKEHPEAQALWELCNASPTPTTTFTPWEQQVNQIVDHRLHQQPSESPVE